jgi:hypothetical protein
LGTTPSGGVEIPTAIADLFLADAYYTGGVFIDQTGNSHNGAPNDAPSYRNDQNGNPNAAMEFNGTSQYVLISDHADLSFGDGSDDSPFSISMWVYIDSVPDNSYAGLIAKENSVLPREWQMILGDSLASIVGLAHFCYDENGSRRISAIQGSETNVGEWAHFVMTYAGDENGNGISLYIDGTAVDTSHGNNSYTAMHNTGADITIGLANMRTLYLDGAVSRVRIWGVELTQEQVQALG